MNGWESLGFESYSEYLNSPFWKDKREWILECFQNKCCDCGTKEKLQIHHLNYIRLGNEGKDDVIVLCEKCHLKQHKKEDEENEICY